MLAKEVQEERRTSVLYLRTVHLAERSAPAIPSGDPAMICHRRNEITCWRLWERKVLLEAGSVDTAHATSCYVGTRCKPYRSKPGGIRRELPDHDRPACGDLLLQVVPHHRANFPSVTVLKRILSSWLGPRRCRRIVLEIAWALSLNSTAMQSPDLDGQPPGSKTVKPCSCGFLA